MTDYLAAVINEYNSDGIIYDLYYTSEDNVMVSGSGYIPDDDFTYTNTTSSLLSIAV